jgi:hypothetical protein
MLTATRDPTVQLAARSALLSFLVRSPEPEPNIHLASLEGVEWKSLNQVYGKAGNVPRLLKEVACGSAKALDTLTNAVAHQGTRYSAAVPTIMVVMEILELHDSNPNLVDLLLFLAVGFDEEHLPEGFDPAGLHPPSLNKRKGFCHRARLFWDGWDYDEDVEVEFNCYHSVLGLMPRLQKLFDEHQELRASLTLLMAYFPASYADNLPRLKTQGIDGILALGLLERQLKLEPTTTDWLEHEDLGFRTAAAIACSSAPTDYRRVIVGHYSSTWLEAGPKRFPKSPASTAVG